MTSAQWCVQKGVKEKMEEEEVFLHVTVYFRQAAVSKLLMFLVGGGGISHKGQTQLLFTDAAADMMLYCNCVCVCFLLILSHSSVYHLLTPLRVKLHPQQRYASTRTSSWAESAPSAKMSAMVELQQHTAEHSCCLICMFHLTILRKYNKNLQEQKKKKSTFLSTTRKSRATNTHWQKFCSCVYTERRRRHRGSELRPFIASLAFSRGGILRSGVCPEFSKYTVWSVLRVQTDGQAHTPITSDPKLQQNTTRNQCFRWIYLLLVIKLVILLFCSCSVFIGWF